MASLQDDEQGEVDRILGEDFPTIRPPQRPASFMASAVLDLCAHLDDGDLYAAVVNDVRFHRMHTLYYRALDTRGQLHIDSDDVAFSVNVF